MTVYRVLEQDPRSAMGDLHIPIFESSEDAEEYIEERCRAADKDMFGEELIHEEDYDYTAGDVYARFSVAKVKL